MRQNIIVTIVMIASIFVGCQGNDASREYQGDDTLRLSGNRLVDTHGNPLMVRGYEMTMDMWLETPGSVGENPNMTLDIMTDDMIRSGANAVRFLFPARLGNGFTAEKIDHYVGKMARNRVVVYLSIFGERRDLLDDRGNPVLDEDGNAIQHDYYDSPAFFGNPEIRAVLDRYSAWLVLDASQECDFDDRARWERVSVAKIREFRAYGYECPLTVMSNTYGRDLPALLSDRARRIFDSDPLRRVIFGWQAYWGDSFTNPPGQNMNWYEYYYGMTLEEGIRLASLAPYPIQLGLDLVADAGSSYMNYRSAMKVAQETGMGWLWWNWYPVWGGNNLSNDGSLEDLTSFGEVVIFTDPYSVRNTSVRATPP